MAVLAVKPYRLSKPTRLLLRFEKQIPNANIVYNIFPLLIVWKKHTHSHTHTHIYAHYTWTHTRTRSRKKFWNAWSEFFRFLVSFQLPIDFKFTSTKPFLYTLFVLIKMALWCYSYSTERRGKERPCDVMWCYVIVLLQGVTVLNKVS